MDRFIAMLEAFFATDNSKLLINTFAFIFNKPRPFAGHLLVRPFVDSLLGKWFLLLFCHWSFNVRLAFYHLLLNHATQPLNHAPLHFNWAGYDEDEARTITCGRCGSCRASNHPLSVVETRQNAFFERRESSLISLLLRQSLRSCSFRAASVGRSPGLVKLLIQQETTLIRLIV